MSLLSQTPFNPSVDDVMEALGFKAYAHMDETIYYSEWGDWTIKVYVDVTGWVVQLYADFNQVDSKHNMSFREAIDIASGWKEALS